MNIDEAQKEVRKLTADLRKYNKETKALKKLLKKYLAFCKRLGIQPENIEGMIVFLQKNIEQMKTIKKIAEEFESLKGLD